MTPEQYRRLEQLFETAVALAADARKAFLSALQVSEPELAKAVAALLAADERSESFIDQHLLNAASESLAQRSGDSGAADPLARAVDEASDAGRQLGPYRLLERLGRGGMGVVYRAEHVETGARAAVKTIEAPERAMLSSLRREIQALARIRHPAIVRILDDGLDQGLPWYAMELLEGTPLNRFWEESSGREGKAQGPAQEAPPAGSRQELNRTRLGPAEARPAEPALMGWWTETLRSRTPSVPEPGGHRKGRTGPRKGRRVRAAAAAGHLKLALRLVHQICAPLGYLHGEGLVHRDLKPQNILVRPDGSTVLIDFGLLATFSQEISREALELEALQAGTAAYMAPEQIRGEGCDARADLYALGCILFELLTGQRPFRGKNISEVLTAHLSSAPAAPSQLVEGVPAEIDELVLRLLAKEPRQRLGHADDVAAALERVGVPPQPAGGPKARPYLYRPGFSGREHELELLRERLARLGRGPGGVVLVGGASGIGKTRLGLELAREATLQGIEVLTGESLPPEQQGGVAVLGPLRRPLQQLADRCRERGLEESERVFGAHGPLLAVYEPSLSTLPGYERHPAVAKLPPQEARLRLYRALSEVFEAVAGRNAPHALPLLLVLDDLQWADGLTLGFLESMTSYPPLVDAKPVRPGLRLMLLGLYRTEEAGETLRRLLGSAHVLHRELGRLEPEAVGSMVAQMLALAAPPARFSAFLDRHAEGNPFFVAEYLRAAVAESLLWRDERGDWQLAEPGTRAAGEPDYEALPLPRSLRELVLRRLQGLPEPALRLAEAASVAGRESDALLLRRMLGLEGRDLDASVQELLRRQVLEEVADGRLRFVHDKLREVAYEQIAPGQRPDLHRAAAAGIEALGEAEERLAELGHHWEQAGDTARAMPNYLRAARGAVRRFADAEAEPLYQGYLRLVEEPTVESVTARAELADDVLNRRGRVKEAVAEQLMVVEEARRLGDRWREADALRILGTMYRETGQMEPAQALFEQVLDLARQLGLRELEGQVLNNLAILHIEQGRTDAARSMFERALLISRELGNRNVEAMCLLNLGGLNLELGRVDEARLLYEQCLDRYRETGNRRVEGVVLSNLGLLHLSQSRRDEARQLLEQSLAIHLETGSRRSRGQVLGHLGIVHLEQGDPDEARRLLQQSLAIHREVGSHRFEGIGLGSLARLERLTGGDLAKAARLAEQGEQILTEEQDKIELGKLLCGSGHIAIAAEQESRGGSAGVQGHRPGRELLQQAQALAETSGARPESELGRLLGLLRRAIEAAEQGEHERMYRGELVVDLPEGLRRWLIHARQLDASQRSAASRDPKENPGHAEG